MKRILKLIVVAGAATVLSTLTVAPFALLFLYLLEM